MAGICNTCKYFRADVHAGEGKPHHCDFQNTALSEKDSRQSCNECVPKSERGKGCCH